MNDARAGRALSLAAQIKEQAARTVVDTLAISGVAAAIVDEDGRLRAINKEFGNRVGSTMRVAPRTGIVRFADATLQAAMERLRIEPGPRLGRSLLLQVHADGTRSTVHLLPLEGAGRDHAKSDGVQMILGCEQVDTARRSAPPAVRSHAC